MKILITGAGGMLGSDLVHRLADKHQLVGMGRRPAPHLKILFQMGDLSRPSVASDWVQSERPEIILHAAAVTDVDRCESNRTEALHGNFEATRYVAEAANRVGALVVFFSTDFVFDGIKPTPYSEDDSPHPINVYGETKLLAERYLLLRGRRFIILRTSWTFGQHGNNFPKKILKQAERGQPLEVISDQFGNPTFTADIAEAVERIIEAVAGKGRSSENQIFHVANEGLVSRYEFARNVLHLRNYSDTLVVRATEETIRRPARRPRNSALSTDKIKIHFGIHLRPWQEALRAYLGGETATVDAHT